MIEDPLSPFSWILSSIPPEVLVLVTNELKAYDICHLYLCGDIQLRNILVSQGGVSQLDFEMRCSPSLLRWPSLLRCFPRFDSFRLSVASDMYLFNITDVCLAEFPPTPDFGFGLSKCP